MKLNPFAGYVILREDEQLSIEPGHMYCYVLAKNGIFIYAKNEIMEVLMPFNVIREDNRMIRGLGTASPFVKLPMKVPAIALRSMVTTSRSMIDKEVLFYLKWGPGWKLNIPRQKISRVSVSEIQSDEQYIPIEVHSHNTMPAFFSSIDNKDENGLRIYGVLGKVEQPVVNFRLRVSIYGHYSVLPYQFVFEPTAEVKNG